MAEINLEVKKVSFNTKGFIEAVQRIVDEALSSVAEDFSYILQDYVRQNGNGSGIMIDSAVSAVESVLKEMTTERVLYEIGIDESKLSGKGEDFMVRVLVVLHGNQAGGSIREKPGVATFKKHVMNKGIPDPDRRTGKDLSQFNQSEDIVEGVIRNALEEIKPVFDDCVRQVTEEISDPAFLNSFVQVG